jgi:hypothetical protein
MASSMYGTIITSTANSTGNITQFAQSMWNGEHANRAFIRTRWDGNGGVWSSWEELEKVGHTHTISQITNLQTTLDGKATSSHTHSTYALKAGDTFTGPIWDYKTCILIENSVHKGLTQLFTVSQGYSHTMVQLLIKFDLIASIEKSSCTYKKCCFTHYFGNTTGTGQMFNTIASTQFNVYYKIVDSGTSKTFEIYLDITRNENDWAIVHLENVCATVSTAGSGRASIQPIFTWTQIGLPGSTERDTKLTELTLFSTVDYITLSSLTWNNIASKPSTFTPATHTHTTSEITSLQQTIFNWIYPVGSVVKRPWNGGTHGMAYGVWAYNPSGLIGDVQIEGYKEYTISLTGYTLRCRNDIRGQFLYSTIFGELTGSNVLASWTPSQMYLPNGMSQNLLIYAAGTRPAAVDNAYINLTTTADKKVFYLTFNGSTFTVDTNHGSSTKYSFGLQLVFYFFNNGVTDVYGLYSTHTCFTHWTRIS